MEIRLLRYFLAVANEGSVTSAAEKLHIAQPTLSKQLMSLEDELGTALFTRGKKKITLTPDGIFLMNRAQEILSLTERTESALRTGAKAVSGEVYIGSADVLSQQLIAQAIKLVRKAYPDVKFHLSYGDIFDTSAMLERGLIHFALYSGFGDDKFNYLTLPTQDTFGLLIRKDDPLAALPRITPADIRSIPLMLPRLTYNQNGLTGWLGYPQNLLNIIGTFGIANLSVSLVEQGVCASIIAQRSTKIIWGENLRFIPLEPALRNTSAIAWSKVHPLPEAALIFLDTLKSVLSDGNATS